MHSVKFLTKHCTTSREGRVALSNTLVETAVKRYNCPIIVTCNDFPNEECILTVSDLTSAVPKTGPHPDQYNPGKTYDLYYYIWKGVSRGTSQTIEEESTEVETTITVSTISRNAKGTYTIKTPVTIIEEREVSLAGYIGAIIKAKRTELGYNKSQLANLTSGACSSPTLGRIETGDTNPTLDILVAICDALGLHITDIFPPKDEEDESEN